MFSKAKIWNLALGALLLSKTISDTENDQSVQAQVFRNHWDMALGQALGEMDLDGTSEIRTLEKIEEYPNDNWNYAYKYPSNCLFFRRISSGFLRDNRSTQIPKKIEIRGGIKVILTNEEAASAEYIPSDLPLETLSSNAAMAIAIKLAWLSAPLITGKGAQTIRAALEKDYILYSTKAQKQDGMENSNFDDDEVISEFVEVRTS